MLERVYLNVNVIQTLKQKRTHSTPPRAFRKSLKRCHRKRFFGTAMGHLSVWDREKTRRQGQYSVGWLERFVIKAVGGWGFPCGSRCSSRAVFSYRLLVRYFPVFLVSP